MQLSLYDPSSIEKKPPLFYNHVVNSRLVSELNPFLKTSHRGRVLELLQSVFALCKDFLKSTDNLSQRNTFFCSNDDILKKS